MMSEIFIPYISFQLRTGKRLWVDAYFSAKLDERFRIAGLIRESVERSYVNSALKLDAILSKDELARTFSEILTEVERKLKLVKIERGKRFGRWSFFRTLFLPFGHSKNLSQDERLSKMQIELMQSAEILRAVSDCTVLGDTGYISIKIKDGLPEDKIYRRLYELDEGFRKEFDEVSKKFQ
ncbi:hypothetical protein Asulf_00385 [Archaeoglobus sulfaticallidus PM70-1]|uniref:Uncharacterized protein n=1 Tax=Archaeoglobus sulfaticallidus PM70-1 TaxID=387631 RepID=N0BDV4_9EURY|nr:hypothetical protein [Archaeoglobus sulfaticallidus]AGK60412.1 hypothetical protein Asulf_00385 [Archaeoglobus sulfaticallidus PM70-1]